MKAAKPKKPKITKPHLTWKLNRQRNEWEPYHRITWTVSGKRKERAVKLDWKGDPKTLDELYWACQSGRHKKQHEKTKYSWENLIREWRDDARIQMKLARGTKQSYGRTMDVIMDKNAKKDVRKTTRQGLRAVHSKLRDTPRKADKYLQTVSLLWNFAVKELNWPLGVNPAKGIEHFGAQREFLAWPDWMVERVADAPPAVRTTAEMILGTGQRPSAAISMKWEHFDGEWMQVLDEKQGEYFDAFCPIDMRQYLKGLRRNGVHVLAKNLTEPLGYDAVEKAFRAWRATLGEEAAPFTLHGLRKLAIIRLAEAGCSDAEIQAVTNQSAETVAYYRRKANKKKLSRAAQERRG